MEPNREYILELIDKKGWSTKEFARNCSVSSPTVSRWLNGKRGAGANLIGGILRAFPEEKVKDLFFY